jgi:hypothetical protein
VVERNIIDGPLVAGVQLQQLAAPDIINSHSFIFRAACDTFFLFPTKNTFVVWQVPDSIDHSLMILELL